MKKIVALSLIAAASLGLAACKKAATNESVTVNETETTATMNETGADMNAAGTETMGNEGATVDNGAAAANAVDANASGNAQ